MATLERAIQIAVKAHAGQPRRDGTPYIMHPLRLMMKMDTDEERIAAVLHDAVEDTPLTFDDLRREGFAESTLEVLRLLTHEEGIEYEDYVRRLKPNPMARKVKMADLEDNSNIRSLPCLAEKDLKRLEKYHRAWCILKD